MAAHRLDEASAACRTLLASDPDAAEGLLLLGEIEVARGDNSAAAAAWRRAISLRPGDAAMHRRLAALLLQGGETAEALPLLRRALDLEPDHPRALNNLGQAMILDGDAAAAVALLERAIEREPAYAAAHYNLGLALMRMGNVERALGSFRQACKINPQFVAAWVQAARAARQRGERASSLELLARALELRGADPELLVERGSVLLEMSRHGEALEDFLAASQIAGPSKAARLGCAEALAAVGRLGESLTILGELASADPTDADVLAARAQAWLRNDATAPAESDARRALELKPTSVNALVSFGWVRLAVNDPAGALQAFERACAADDTNGAGHAGRGFALERLERFEEALAAHGRAVSLGWLEARALLSVGSMLLELNRFENALAAFREALRTSPDSWRAKEGLAMCLVALRRFEEAVPALESLRQAAPWIDYLPGHLFHARLQCCDWRGYEETRADIARRVRHGERADMPWSFLTHSTDPEAQLICARTYANRYRNADVRPRIPERAAEKIRIAYVSADFHDHATARLAAGLFERHDRTRFETLAISYGPRREDFMRERLRRAFDGFLDVAERSDGSIAGMLREAQIDIAIDVKGFTTGGRPGILASRPAPVQIAFLAFPGTMGCDWIDYIIADRQVIPESAEDHYAEKVIRMPGCYQVNERAPDALLRMQRRAAGLPERGFVFCCFNASYKISPQVFAAWMRILKRTEHGVLWLLEGPALAMRNLRSEARRHGVEPSRLVFAAPLPVTEHWGRIGLADLFLDTSPCNAHTTASDALRAGVPLITLAGATFAGRVATSLLHAVGLRECSTATMHEYEELAVRLAESPDELAALRMRLTAAVEKGSPFDANVYCRHLEAALTEVHRRALRGEAPRALDVSRLASLAVADA
jgi:predicted O-linked N-acetylglucosamine transferase (SPINDLY family)